MKSVSKRYILLRADHESSQDEWNSLVDEIDQRFGRTGRVPLKENGRFFILKTDNFAVSRIRSECTFWKVGTSNIVSVLTSGSVGKLKRMASGSSATVPW